MVGVPMTSMERRLPARYLAISLALYLLGLCFDGARMSGGAHMPALQMLIYGPWGMPFGLFQWLANPLLAVAILVHRRWRRLALLAGLLALYLAASSLGIERLPDNQSYAFATVTGLGGGFWLWLAAILVFCLGQGWWCWKARAASDMPGWHWLDMALLLVLAFTCHAATQMPSLRFDPQRVLAPAEPSQVL